MKKTMKRILSAALCALTLLAAIPAFAATGTAAAGTKVYVGASTAQEMGTINTAGQVTILGESGDFYQISASGGTGYVLKSMVTPDASGTTTTTAATPTATPAANAGYVTGVKNDAPLRAEASKSSTLLENAPLHSALVILSTSGDYTQVTTAAGNTGFILSKYVAYGTPSAPAAASNANDVMLETPQQMVSVAKTIYMRKTPDKSTKSSNVVKKLSGVKGHVFNVIGTNGSTWYKATYGEYTGYVLMVDLASPSATGTLSAGSYATGDKAKDKWGEIVKIDGTNIGTAFGKLYDNSIYCNGLNKKNEYYYNGYDGRKNYFYMLSPQGAPIHVLMSHNMQSSKTGGHYLHHVQNAWLGVSKCEKCKESCANAKTSIFYINYDGKTQWQLIGFFEGNASMRNYAAVNFGLTGAAKKGWIDTFLSYCTSKYKGAVLGSAADTDDVMSFITCGDNGSKGGTYLCMLLKAVA